MQQKRNYTLVELLVVIGIIGILFGIALPAFNRLTQGNKVTAAARNLNTAISQARSLAVMQRQYVALLLPATTSTTPLSYFTPQYLYKSFRLCYVTNASGVYTFKSWTDDGVWRFFPAGVILYGACDGTTAVWDKLLTVNAVDGTAGNICTSLIFNPYGGLENDSLNISVVEGIHDVQATGATDVTYTAKDGSGNPVPVYMRITKFTGRCSFL